LCSCLCIDLPRFDNLNCLCKFCSCSLKFFVALAIASTVLAVAEVVSRDAIFAFRVSCVAILIIWSNWRSVSKIKSCCKLSFMFMLVRSREFKNSIVSSSDFLFDSSCAHVKYI
jgi:hypothetical protein